MRPGTGLTGARCRELFAVQLGSRLLDVAARLMRERDEGFYTIGSSGHEGNAAVAAALRVDDPALLHYRSGAFYLTRSAQAGRLAEEGLRDVLLGIAASAEEPIAGGGTRSSATPASPSSRRPPRSPATCRARSASASRSSGHACSGCPRPGRGTPSPSAASATRR
ncbi:hypothetical protein GCM10027612_63610 [Microbispora bryophytorum subsp. camponoti]